jgi:hypothetical protein
MKNRKRPLELSWGADRLLDHKFSRFISSRRVRAFNHDASLIERLRAHGLLTRTEAERARRRLRNKVQRSLMRSQL